MAIPTRIWFANAPGGDAFYARQQLSIGVNTINVSGVVIDETYIRRYLGDPLVIATPGSFSPPSGSEDAFSEYVRRYLGDPV